MKHRALAEEAHRGTHLTSEWSGYRSTPVKETPRKETKTAT